MPAKIRVFDGNNIEEKNGRNYQEIEKLRHIISIYRMSNGVVLPFD